MKKKKIVIVGAGPGGLTSAMILARRGFDVELIEKNTVVGGRSAALAFDGFTFDTGPTFLMMKFVLDEMFAEAGEDIGDHLEAPRLDPMYRLVFADRAIDMTSDHAAMKREIARLFPSSAADLDKFLKREGERFEKVFPCLQKDYSSFKEFFNPIFLRAIPYIPIGRSIFDYLGNYFGEEKLRLCFTFQSKYLGMSPWECPGFFSILPYVEHRFGVYHVQGGLSRISEAMAQIAEKNGARIRLGAGVAQVIVEKGTARGVVLESGERIMADEVVLNADFADAMNRLIAPGVLKKYAPERLARKEYSCSTFMLYLGVDKVYDELPHHTIFFAQDYRACIESIFNTKELTGDVSFYIRNSAVTDPHVAPKGHSGLYVLVPVPNQKSGIDWEKEKGTFRKLILKKIAERSPLHDIEQHIVAERMITPHDWQKSNIYLGATFNLAHTMTQMLYFRPHNRFEEIENMYLVGGGTHPGSGLPTIYESARIASNLISRKYGVAYREPSKLSEKLAARPPSGRSTELVPGRV
ncbi:MAG TPA: phytoene desaturase family protein [Terracidiphilus sp.]|nr:phytoene desaturase family protein [Terracidiphilus sp.]